MDSARSANLSSSVVFFLVLLIRQCYRSIHFLHLRPLWTELEFLGFEVVVHLWAPPVLLFVLHPQRYHNESLVLLVCQRSTCFEECSK